MPADRRERVLAVAGVALFAALGLAALLLWAREGEMLYVSRILSGPRGLPVELPFSPHAGRRWPPASRLAEERPAQSG